MVLDAACLGSKFTHWGLWLKVDVGDNHSSIFTVDYNDVAAAFVSNCVPMASPCEQRLAYEDGATACVEMQERSHNLPLFVNSTERLKGFVIAVYLLKASSRSCLLSRLPCAESTDPRRPGMFQVAILILSSGTWQHVRGAPRAPL